MMSDSPEDKTRRRKLLLNSNLRVLEALSCRGSFRKRTIKHVKGMTYQRAPEAVTLLILTGLRTRLANSLVGSSAMLSYIRLSRMIKDVIMHYSRQIGIVSVLGGM